MRQRLQTISFKGHISGWQSGRQCGCKSGSQIRWVLPRYGGAPILEPFQDHKSGSQILFAMCKSGTQTRWVLPRRDSTPNRRQIHRISPLPNMAIYYTDIQMKSITLAHRAVWPPTRRKPKSHACLQKLYFNRTR